MQSECCLLGSFRKWAGIRDVIDFSSDLLSGMPPQSLSALTEAAGRSLHFTPEDDPDFQRLAEATCGMLGFESALFVPSCTLANQIALSIWCGRNGEALADSQSHLATIERETTQRLWGTTLQLAEGKRGHLSPAAVRQAVAQAKGVKLVWLEDTHMRAGGTVMPAGWLADIASDCARRGLPIHLDGSRIWNAAVAARRPLEELARGANSIAVSLNKGLGAPAGSLLLGERSFIAEAGQIQKTLGCGLRPMGILAAAALPAVQFFEERMSLDHDRATRLFRGLQDEVSSSDWRMDPPDTNIVLLDGPSSQEVASLVLRMAEGGIQCLTFGETTLRFVVHARISDGDIDRTAEVVGRHLASAPRG